MAKSDAVWGIDVGQCALKALRCRRHEKDTNRIVVEAFDYIEYPKLLSQQDADREELVQQALETFLERNDIAGDSVTISVPGQNGLARFVKLPPVEQKKIPDIVKYEAKTQIPFALEDVVWDYEPLPGGNSDDGYALETEVGLFAMKRDSVARALEPMEDAGIEVDQIQLAPLAVYNFAVFDRLNNLEEAEDFDPENQPPSIVLLSLGAETTDLVVTNGYRVWQRSIPIGGSHFTKALSKELKLTFAKAEHLKRNAMKAEDPKAVFQAMRPVFSELVSEIQRSIGFYLSNNRGAQLKEVVAFGNPMKLPGLQRYLSQNLEQELVPLDEFNSLIGGSVTGSPQFKENHLSFPVAYGLCVQGLGFAQLGTSLLPEEIITKRLVRSKKPWAVAAAATLLLGLTANYFSHVASWQTVDVEDDWKSALSSASQLSTTASGYTGRESELRTQFEEIKSIGMNLQSNADGRLLWLELIKAIDSVIPKDERAEAERKQTRTDVAAREELHIESVECKLYPDLSTWFSGPVQKLYEDALKSDELAETAAAAEAAAAEEAGGGEQASTDAEAAAGDESEAGAADEALADGSDQTGTEEAGMEDDFAADEAGMDDGGFGDGGFDEGGMGDEFGEEGGGGIGPSGEGWVIQLVGHHFHNSNPDDPDNQVSKTDEGEQFVRRTLIKNLLEGTVQLPDGPNGELVDVPLTDMGISYPVVVTKLPVKTYTYDPNADSSENAGRTGGMGMGMEMGMGMGMGRGGTLGAAGEGEEFEEPERWELRRYDFIIQFIWKPTPRNVRLNGPEEGSVEEDEFGV